MTTSEKITKRAGGRTDKSRKRSTFRPSAPRKRQNYSYARTRDRPLDAWEIRRFTVLFNAINDKCDRGGTVVVDRPVGPVLNAIAAHALGKSAVNRE